MRRGTVRRVAVAMLLAGVGIPCVAAAQDMAPPASAAASDDAYRYLDDADALLDAMGTSPPDFGFRFDGVDCWAWTMADDYLILAEPLGDDYRYYLFAPDDDRPFFVGDRFYAYGFDGGTLAAVYGENGDLVDPSDDIVDGAEWLSERGFAMKRAASDREPVYADDWADSIGWFGAIELRLDSWRDRPGWIRYRTGIGRLHHRDWREKLDVEGTRRRERADWFDRWRRDGYRGAPRDGGNWVTAPGGKRPPAAGDNGKGKWTGRPRPVAPPTPVGRPGRPGRDDGTRPERRPRDEGTPATPAPAPTAVLPTDAGSSGATRPDRPVRFPGRPPIGTRPPAATPSAPSAPIRDGRDRPSRPIPIDRSPGAMIKNDRGTAPVGALSPPAAPTRPAPTRVPPVSVAPRPNIVPRIPPPAPAPPPPAATPRSAAPAAAPRSPGPGPSSRGGARGGGERSGDRGRNK